MDPKTVEDLTKRISDALPSGLRELQQDVEKNIRAALESGFSKLNLVTREEFEVQQGVLARTRAKVDTLEKKVEELEAALAAKPGNQDG
ncbi:MAG TPA: accessory factor UbiK family protein [Gammaproteobacteria bacterium]|nr:accessory factor UbiK family protein [Gammaproteobacteria bacterium]